MPRQMFLNLPVADLPKSKAFFAALGFAFNPQFTGDDAACMVIEEGSIYAMLLTHAQFEKYSPLPIADARRTKEVLITLSCVSRAEVDALVAKALAGGGTTPDAAKDHGFMYDHGFQDLDGHAWGLMWMSDQKSS